MQNQLPYANEETIEDLVESDEKLTFREAPGSGGWYKLQYTFDGATVSKFDVLEDDKNTFQIAYRKPDQDNTSPPT